MSRKRKKKGNGIVIWTILIILAISGLFGKSKDENEYNKPAEVLEAEPRKISDFYDNQENRNKETSVQNSIDAEKNEDYTLSETKASSKYVNDDVLNQLMNDYNQIAEFELEQWRTGAYPFNAIMMCNGVYIVAYNSNSIFVDFSIEDWDDSHIYPAFRDFLKIMDSSLTDDAIYSGWNELLTGKYIGYKYYDIGKIECSCWVNQVSNGQYSYTVKTGCKNYKETE